MTERAAPTYWAGNKLPRSERPLTQTQSRTLQVIKAWITLHGGPPSLREIAQTVGIKSTNAVNDHLIALEAKGYITRDKRLARGIQLVGNSGCCPLCGNATDSDARSLDAFNTLEYLSASVPGGKS